MRNKIKAWLTPRKPAWWPVDFTADDLDAVRACWGGTATADQQRHAMKFIILACGQHSELSFRSERDGGERETAFAQGRWFVAQTLTQIIGLKTGYIVELRRIENAGTRNTSPAQSRNASPGSPLVDPDKHAKSGS